MNNNFKKITINFLSYIKKFSIVYFLATFVKNLIFYINWNFQRVNTLFISNNHHKKILIVYDLNSQPYSIGDFINLQEASLIISKIKKLQQVDCAIIYDKKNPAKSDIVFKNIVNSDNVLDFINNLLPLCQLNFKIGSIFLFNSTNFFIKFLKQNNTDYFLWPPYNSIKSGIYLSPIIFNSLLYKYHLIYKSIPYLTSSIELQDWASSFFNSHSKNKVFVTVNLRVNMNWSSDRNSAITEWITFFNYCANLFEVTFFIICKNDEIDPMLHKCTNTILVKKYNTNVAQDLALIQNSHFHMGANSGPSTIAWFSEKPFLTVNMKLNKGIFYKNQNMIIDLGGGFQRLNFFKDNQLIYMYKETAHILINAFENIWPKISSIALKN